MTTEKKRTPQDADKFIVRLPPGMREHIADAAAKNHRSMNAEMIARLEQTFRWDQVGHQHPSEITAEIEHSAHRLQELIREFRMQQVVIYPPDPPLPYVDDEEDVDLPVIPPCKSKPKT